MKIFRDECTSSVHHSNMQGMHISPLNSVSSFTYLGNAFATIVHNVVIKTLIEIYNTIKINIKLIKEVTLFLEY